MTGEQIIDRFRFLVDDDTLSSDDEVAILNVAYDRLMAMRDWHFLEKSDSSNTVALNTAAYSLPSDFLKPLRAWINRSGEETYHELQPVPFRERLKYSGSSRYFYIDAANGNLVLTDTPVSGSDWIGASIVIDYLYQPDQLTTSTSPVFNRAFHNILAYEMAYHYYYNDQGEKSRSWDGELKGEYEKMKNQMYAWDDAIKNQVDPVPTMVHPWSELNSY